MEEYSCVFLFSLTFLSFFFTLSKILSSPDTNHPTVQAMRQFEDGFNRICRRYSPDGPGEEEEQEGGESKEEGGEEEEEEEEEDSDLDLDDEGW